MSPVRKLIGRRRLADAEIRVRAAGEIVNEVVDVLERTKNWCPSRRCRSREAGDVQDAIDILRRRIGFEIRSLLPPGQRRQSNSG